jgi:hypothetical protein
MFFGPTALRRHFEPQRMRDIADIRAWRSQRWTLERIADALTAHAVPTKSGKSAAWTHQTVARIARRA